LFEEILRRCGSLSPSESAKSERGQNVAPIAQCFWNLHLQMNPQETNAAVTLKSRFVRFAFMNSREALEKVLDMIVYWVAYGHKNTHPRGKKLLGA
jgi:hypothetical protein